MKRQLDCALIQLVHMILESKGRDVHDTVDGVFDHGDLVSPGAGFRDKTLVHIRNHEMILGYFRVEGMTWAPFNGRCGIARSASQGLSPPSEGAPWGAP